MVVQKIKDIDVKKLKQAQGVMAVFELLGINEDDLLLLKNIPSMLKELEELREFKEKMSKTVENTAKNVSNKPLGQVINDVYNPPIKEFNPHYEQ